MKDGFSLYICTINLPMGFLIEILKRNFEVKCSCGRYGPKNILTMKWLSNTLHEINKFKNF